MRMRCLVVSLASSWRHRPLAAGAMLALFAAHSAGARADGAFTLTSANVRGGGTLQIAQVFDQSDCKGGNHSPQLTWRDAPAGTRGFAITMFDEDAPGRGWWHWVVAGIPASVNTLPENASSSGFLQKLGAVEARNDFDTDGYGGPCPPPGKPHRYVITVYALNSADLHLAQGRPALMFDHEIGTAAIGSARLVVNYGR
ncbi:PEBP family protein [Burkholderia sp. H160]|nr:PEBP family protein [Burkholderia sp. H160]